jgi:hypothetical protein
MKDEKVKETREKEGRGDAPDAPPLVEDAHPLIYSMTKTSRDLFFFDLGSLHECIAQIMRGTAEQIEYAPQLEDVRVWERDTDLETGRNYSSMLEIEVRAFCADLDLKYLKFESEGRKIYLLGRSLQDLRKSFAETHGEQILNESSEKTPYFEWEAPQDFEERVGSFKFPSRAKKES